MKIVVVVARVLLGLPGMEVSALLRVAGYSQCCIDERLSAWQGHIPAWDAVG